MRSFFLLHGYNRVNSPLLRFTKNTTAVVVNFFSRGLDPRKLSPNIFQPGTANTREKIDCTKRGGNAR